MKSAKIIAWVTIGVSIAGSVLTLYMTAPASQASGAFHSSILQSVMATLIQIGAASLFVWSLKGFKHALRVAYGLICAGIVMLGFSNLQLPIVSYFDLSHTIYVTGGIIVIPYIAPALLVFFGVQRFARLFQLKSVWMSFWFVMGLGIIFALCGVLLGKVVAPPGGENFVASIGLSAWTSAFLLATVIIMVAVKRVAGLLYSQALGWFVAARVVVTVTGFSYTLLLILFGDKNVLFDYGAPLTTSIIAALLFLRSGYAFKLINEDPELRAAKAAKPNISIIDIITFAASQASHPAEIDETLDTLRIVTADLQAGDNRTLTAAQQETLKRTYADIERYLVEQEPIRRLTREEIRRKCATYFGLDDGTFTAIITPATQPQF